MNGIIKINNIRFQQNRIIVYFMPDPAAIRFYYADVHTESGEPVTSEINFEMKSEKIASMIIKSIDDDFKSGSKFIDVDKTLELLNGDG